MVGGACRIPHPGPRSAVKQETRLILLAASPFVVWISLQSLLPATALAYAIRSVATGMALAVTSPLLFRTKTDPSETRSASSASSFLFGLLGGLLVLALWVLPEFSDLYRTWCCWPLGKLPAAPTEPVPYAPATCGWLLTLAKLIGSAFIIAPAEELFFRFFLYRWLQNRDFCAVPHTRFDLSAFLWMIFLFLLEHDRPLAAAAAGAIYGLLYIRFGLLAAILAHVTTNLLLGLYVILFNAWAFW